MVLGGFVCLLMLLSQTDLRPLEARLIGFTVCGLFVVLGTYLFLRPSIWVVLDGDDMLYGRVIGKGHICLSEIAVIKMGRWGIRTVIRTHRGKVHWYYMMAWGWDLLKNIVRDAKNAKVDSRTIELLDKDSPRYKKANRIAKGIVKSGKVYGTCVVVFMLGWLIFLLATGMVGSNLE